jgi:hypothetical protein
MADREIITTGYIITLIALFIIFSPTFVLDGINRDLFFDEGGVVEVASAIGYFLCVLLILYKGKINYLRKYYYFILLFIMSGFREQDFHKRFTTMGILKIKFFISPNVPLTEKLIGFLIVLLLLHVLISIYKNHFRQFIGGLKNHSTISIGVLIVLLLLGVSKTLDGISRKLGSFEIEIGSQIAIHLAALEEVLELGIPMFLLLIYYEYFDKHKV